MVLCFFLPQLCLFKTQAHIPVVLRKVLPKGGVVLLFHQLSLRCFLRFVRCVVALSFGRWVGPQGYQTSRALERLRVG